MSVRIRRAGAEDVDFLVELANHEEVEPYLAGGRPRDREAVATAVERSSREPGEYGRFAIFNPKPKAPPAAEPDTTPDVTSTSDLPEVAHV